MDYATDPDRGFELMETPSAIPRSLAHEMRTPLAAVITTLELITDETLQLDPSEIVEIVQAAKADANHLLEVIEAARGGAQDTDRVNREANVVDVVSRALMRFPGVQARTRVRVDPLVTALIDDSHLDQIVTNLFQNVARYAPDGLVELRIYANEGNAVVEVADEGPGIDDPDSIFEAHEAGSSQGMHVGLSISRELAAKAGGTLEVAEPLLSGATFRLTVPSGARGTGSASQVALAPRARVLVELAAALSERSLVQAEAGLSRIAADLLGARATAVLVSRPGGAFRQAGRDNGLTVPVDDPLIVEAVSGQARVVVRREGDLPEWWSELVGGSGGLIVPLAPDTDDEALLVLGLPDDRLEDVEGQVVRAIATVAEVAVSRVSLGRALGVERGLRATVLDALPIAISVFAGDPPRVIDMNERERKMLGLGNQQTRPSVLDESQRAFDVRFADGTPLTLENAPVALAIREGVSQGPFILRVRRADGTEFLSRTYSAPFFDSEGNVVGAVVTSEELTDERW